MADVDRPRRGSGAHPRGARADSAAASPASGRCASRRSRADVHESIAGSDDYFRYATLGLAVQRVLDEDDAGRVRRGGRVARRDERVPAPRSRRSAAVPVRHVRGLPRRGPARRARPTRASATRARQAVRRRVGPSQNVVLRPGLRARDAGRPGGRARSRSCCSTSTCSSPTRASLEFFYPRLSPGGYLVMHDYNNAGVRLGVQARVRRLPRRTVPSSSSSSATCGARR